MLYYYKGCFKNKESHIFSDTRVFLFEENEYNIGNIDLSMMIQWSSLHNHHFSYSFFLMNFQLLHSRLKEVRRQLVEKLGNFVVYLESLTAWVLLLLRKQMEIDGCTVRAVRGERLPSQILRLSISFVTRHALSWCSLTLLVSFPLRRFFKDSQ